MLIDREKVSSASRPTEVLDVPELGGEVEIRGLLLGERLRLYTMAAEDSGRIDIAALLAMSVYASDGKPLWTKDQWDAWGEAAAAVRLFTVAARLGGLLQDDAEKKPEAPIVSS